MPRRKDPARYADLWPKVIRVVHPKTGQRGLVGYDKQNNKLQFLPFDSDCKTWSGKASRAEWDVYVRSIRAP